MKLASLVMSALLLLSGNTSAAEAITVAEYVQLKKDLKDSLLVTYLSGAADALHGANTVLKVTGRPQIYCGRTTALSATEAIRTIDELLAQQIRRGNVAPSGMSVALVLANALSAKHPCK